MHCRNKLCSKALTNPRNIVKGDDNIFCSHGCFLIHDAKLECAEERITFIRTRIQVLRQMRYQLYYIRRPVKTADIDRRIAAYRIDLESEYQKIKEI